LQGKKNARKNLTKLLSTFFSAKKKGITLSRMKMHATEEKEKKTHKTHKTQKLMEKKKVNTKKTITSGKTKNPGRRRRRKLHTHLPSARNNKVGMDPNDMTKGGRSSSCSCSNRSSSRGTKKKGGGGRREEGLEGYWVGWVLTSFFVAEEEEEED
jgi:hypothetical protein